MSNLEQFLTNRKGIPEPEWEYKTSSVNIPVIGDVISSPSEKHAGIFDTLLCDGAAFDPLVYPLLFAELGVATTPNMTPIVSTVPYRIVADLT